MRVKRLLTYLVILFSVMIPPAIVRWDLARLAAQVRDDFIRQNYAELARSDSYALATKLNSLSTSAHWLCIEGERGGKTFFQKSLGSCGAGLLSHSFEIGLSSNNDIKVRMVLGVPIAQKILLGAFVLLQVMMLALVQALIRANARAETVAQAELTALASQVSHDIRSPVAALLAVLQNAKGLDEQSRVMLGSAATRIRDIASNMLDKNRAAARVGCGAESALSATSCPALSQEPRSVELLSLLVESIVSEKRAQCAVEFPALVFECDSSQGYGLFSEVQPIECSRVLSNLLNNAREAFDGYSMQKSPQITVTIARNTNSTNGAIDISVSDNGKGISPGTIAKLCERGQSFGKANGSGLGLFHARATVRSWGGDLTIESALNKGTRVVIRLYAAESPSWFAQELQIPANATIVVLDDDPGIHELWKQRLGDVCGDSAIKLVHFTKAEEVKHWYRETLGGDGPTQYWFDYELGGSSQTGLDTIDMLGIKRDAILVTSRAEDASLRSRCEKLGVKLLPKLLAHVVPLTF